LAFRHDVGKQVSFAKDVRTRTTLPEKSAGRDFSLRDGGRTRSFRPTLPGGQAELPTSAQAVSTAAQSRSPSV
jgi:hypothetical protein